MATIALVDDHLLVRDAVAAMLTRHGHTVIPVATPEELDDVDGIELVLLDLDLGPAGLVDEDTVLRLRERGSPVLVVSALGSRRQLQRIIAAGVLGVVGKADGTDDLLAAVTAALAGRTWTAPMLAQAMATDDAIRPELSEQELLALRLYACGLKLDSVARRMGIASSTAKQYIDRVRRKYAAAGSDVRTRSELYSIAIEDGFINPRADPPHGTDPPHRTERPAGGARPSTG